MSKLLNDSTVSKFVTRKWIETPMLRPDMSDYSDVYVVVKGTIDLRFAGNNAITQKGVVFKNNVSFMLCISQINNTFTDNLENLDIVMPIYNLLDYIDNYSMTP